MYHIRRRCGDRTHHTSLFLLKFEGIKVCTCELDFGYQAFLGFVYYVAPSSQMSRIKSQARVLPAPFTSGGFL